MARTADRSRSRQASGDATDEQPLAGYRGKRNFAITPEPPPARAAGGTDLSYVIQKHWASRLHYDFRLELDGVLLSWAVPKGPCLDPAEKRMAVHVEDHPVDYGVFEGDIPKGQYGAGRVIVWDRGTWEPVGDPRTGMRDGKLVFRLQGAKLRGLWELVRIGKPGERQDSWMLFKKRDAWARPLADYDVLAALPDRVPAPKPVRTPAEEAKAAQGAAAAAPPSASASASQAASAKAQAPARTPGKAPTVRSRLPATLSPQLATLASSLPDGTRWLLEPKWDGYRLLARCQSNRVRLFTRNGHDWTDRLRPIAEAVKSLALNGAWLDGEIVVLSPSGAPDFNRLQNAIDNRRSEEIVYFIFDLPFHDGCDLRAMPTIERRGRLRALLEGRGEHKVRFSQDFDAPADQMLQAACAMQLEGLIAKRADAPYVSRRSDTWLKLKCSQRQEFVVVGFHDRQGAAGEVGSLVLATREGDQWRHAGSVGTGWDSPQGRAMHAALSRIRTAAPPLDPGQVTPGRWSRRGPDAPQWVRPEMVVEVSFAEWTPEGRVRHATFKGVRGDKAAAEVVRESSAALPGAPTVKVTNPTRVVDPSTGVTKQVLVRYYESVAESMLPHLAARPVSLVRAPEGITGPLFFQKHPESRMPGLTELDPALWPGHGPLLAVDSLPALLAAAQMNVVEFHTWNSTVAHIDQPDRVIFDLDPGEGVTWPALREAALLVREMLSLLGLQCWLKTSGGKGLHVVVHLVPQHAYPVVKAFSQAVVQHLAATIPQRFVAKSGEANRVGRIFVDYLRNGHGQTTAAAFSVRARAGLGVSMPVSWDQLPDLKSGAHWTVQTARDQLSFQRQDPWETYWSSPQHIDEAMATLGVSTRGMIRR